MFSLYLPILHMTILIFGTINDVLLICLVFAIQTQSLTTQPHYVHLFGSKHLSDAENTGLVK